MPAGTNEKPLRLFLALWPEDSVRLRLGATMAALKPTVSGRWLRPEQLHLTLAFLGAVERQRLPELNRIAARAAGLGFDLLLDRVECWPRNGIVCLAPGAVPSALLGLAERLNQGLGQAGYRLDPRPFRAHLTLARDGRPQGALGSLAAPIWWPVRSFSLVESRLEPRGAIYRVLETWPLADPRD
ncbi:RNA 2',3'-cyclic phosphodiesterase [Candidatus Methylocalor cossyra]|uniref:RNA 2',3'-cyclic phosphodiesterase n=1 Tax=Candidatus Methylocalor cossyra TaxID=3108543 RepID=A0ABP1C5U2_9GAMM